MEENKTRDAGVNDPREDKLRELTDCLLYTS